MFLMSCMKFNSSSLESCANDGEIHFIYIDAPCEECIIEIQEFFNSNSNIFDYNMVRHKENHVLINYCYNSKKTDVIFIEKNILDMGLSINGVTINSPLCCTSQ